MDDNAKQASSYHLDQEILDARGITMTVEEVAGLSTCKYAERVAELRLTDDNMAFLKSLRRRIKNRLASQNSRRRSMEHLRRLTRELRALRACRDEVMTERRALTVQRDHLRDTCVALREFIAQTLEDRCDSSTIPELELPRIQESPIKEKPKKSDTPLLTQCLTDKIDKDKHTFECRIEKIVQNSVNHIYKSEKDNCSCKKTNRDKKIFAKTVFLPSEINSNSISNSNSEIISMLNSNSELISMLNSNSEICSNSILNSNSILKQKLESVNQPNSEGSEKSIEQNGVDGVLNLSVKRRSHGRKQSAPRRITYAYVESDDVVLDLKVKKPQ